MRQTDVIVTQLYNINLRIAESNEILGRCNPKERDAEILRYNRFVKRRIKLIQSLKPLIDLEVEEQL